MSNYIVKIERENRIKEVVAKEVAVTQTLKPNNEFILAEGVRCVIFATRRNHADDCLPRDPVLLPGTIGSLKSTKDNKEWMVSFLNNLILLQRKF